MKIEKQPQENCTLTLTVELDDARVQPELRAAARRISQQYKIPGFRPGKAPFETVVRHVGEGAVYGEAIEKLGPKIYEEALTQENIEAYAPGELADVKFKPMVLTFNVPLRPEVELGDYRALRVDYTAPAVEDAAVQEAIEHLREHQAELAPVDRPAELGDVVTLDAKGYLHEGENPSDFLLADKDVALLLDEKADWPMPGFAPLVVGLRAGEEKKFDLTFPEDYANASLRGEVAHFEVTAKEVKSRSLPEWSDEVAKSLGDYESLEDLRNKVRADLVQQAERSTRREYADKVMDQLVAQAQVKYPPVLLEQELDEFMEDLDRRLREQRLTLDDYLKIEGKTKEDLREEVRPQAEERLKRTLVLGRLVDLEGITVEDTDVNQQLDTMAAPFGERGGEIRKMLDNERSRRMVRLDLLSDRAVDRLIAIARGEEVPPPAAQAQPEGEAADQPAAEQPAAEQPANEQPAAEAAEAAPAAETPVTETAEARAADAAATAEASN